MKYFPCQINTIGEIQTAETRFNLRLLPVALILLFILILGFWLPARWKDNLYWHHLPDERPDMERLVYIPINDTCLHLVRFDLDRPARNLVFYDENRDLIFANEIRWLYVAEFDLVSLPACTNNDLF